MLRSNHKEHDRKEIPRDKGHKADENLFFVLYVLFVPRDFLSVMVTPLLGSGPR
jgi:hypothetical protein